MNNKTNCFFLLFLFFTILYFPVPSVYAADIDKVICVPWQGDTAKYHTTWSGHSIRLKAVVTTSNTTQFWYKWNFGDGSESAVLSLSGATKYNIEIAHIYNGTVGTPFTARLIAANNNALAASVSDPYLIKIEDGKLDSKINVAIDNGLWYLYKSGSNASSYYHTFDGSPFMVWSYDSYFASSTASAVQAFEINGHKETGNPNEDPYVTAVVQGLNWLFNGYYYSTSYPMLNPVNIASQHGDNPDTDGNGIGIEVRDYGYRPVYEGGMVMDAIIASNTPDADSGRDFDGDGKNDTYRQVVQNMADMYAWGQYDGAYSTYGILGGWRYGWGDAPDNSACQWGAIGMIPAQAPPWNITVPAWVKTYNNNWLNYSHYQWNWDGTKNIWGGFGYTGPSWGDALTPSGMVQLAFAGNNTDDPRWVRSERWFADNWKDVGRDWLDQNNVYAYYAFAKAMRLALPTPVATFSQNNFDWYRGDGITMGLAEKIANKLVADSSWDYYGPNLGTAWSVIILKPVLFAEAPVACFDADPNPSYPDQNISFDPSCSGHSEAGKDIGNLNKFEWDWNNDGVYDQSTTSPATSLHAFSCASIPCTYPVQLRVTDDSVPARTATYVQNILISNPPHPPVAKVLGPSLVSTCGGDTLSLDGSRSYDPDEGTHEAGCSSCPDDTLTAWAWDLNGAPWNFDGPTGETVDLSSANYFGFGSTGSHNIGLRVSDNTKLAYPGSGQENLTDEEYTSVEVSEGCICEVTATPGCNYVTLSWDNIGAEKYVVLKSTTSPNLGFEDIGVTTENSKSLGSFVMGQTTYYRIMAITGQKSCMSKAVAVYADPQICNPTADPNGPYQGCIGKPVTLDGSGSTAQTGTVVTWEWDLDHDGQYDDALGKTVQHTWNALGIYPIGLKVVSSDNLILNDEGATTVEIKDCASKTCDVNSDGKININDIKIITAARNTVNPVLDIDGDGTVTVLDARKCVLQCDNAQCKP